jgi:hypothetical protein
LPARSSRRSASSPAPTRSASLTEQKAVELKAQIDAWRDLSTSLAIDEADTAAEPASA